MFDRHRLAYAALALVYSALTVILILDRAVPRAACSLLAALIYAALYKFQSNTLTRHESDSS